MPYIEWFDQLSTGIPEIDGQHQKLVAILNDLYDNLKKGSTRTIIDNILEELVRYAVYHFETEEKLMEGINYPGTAFHKREHEIFVTKVKEFLEKEKTQKLISIELLLFLKDWLIKHIIAVDRRLGNFVSSSNSFNK